VRHDNELLKYEQRHADLTRTHGADHPDTLRLARELAERYRDAGRVADAVALAEPVHAALA